MASLARREHPLVAELFDWMDGGIPPVFRPALGGRLLRVEDFIEGGQYVVRAELPGIDPAKDLTVTIDDGVLTLKAERQEEQQDARRSEFRYGAFTRSITLPTAADENDVKATYTEGIVEIRIGMKAAETPTPKEIPVTAS